jgi:hypothetical protein
MLMKRTRVTIFEPSAKISWTDQKQQLVLLVWTFGRIESIPPNSERVSLRLLEHDVPPLAGRYARSVAGELVAARAERACHRGIIRVSSVVSMTRPP